jgi:8-oxo-dGTP pyrophosphatase MutT (NUDIX family)
VLSPSVAELRRALIHEPVAEPRRNHAAVALIGRGHGNAVRELCFIVRAERAGDRWSGQVAFPGGRPDAADNQLRDTAERETREEVGLDLSVAEHLGALPPVPIRPSNDGGVLAPFVYYAGAETPPFELEESEVRDAFWTPVSHLYDPSHRTTLDWHGLKFPAIRLGEHVLWGLTLRVCELWSKALGRSLDITWPPVG